MGTTCVYNPGWYVHNLQSCDTVCAKTGEACNDTQMRAVDDSDKVTYVASVLGYTCASTNLENGNWAPFITTNTLACQWNGAANSECNSYPSSGRQKFFAARMMEATVLRVLKIID